MTERVKSSFRIERRTIGCCEYHARSSDRDADRAGSRDSHSDRSRGLIARACNDGRPFAQSRLSGSCGRNAR